MRKNILFLLFVCCLAWAGTLTYTTQEVEDAVAIVVGDTTDGILYVSKIVFTNGWSLICTNGIEHTAP